MREHDFRIVVIVERHAEPGAVEFPAESPVPVEPICIYSRTRGRMELRRGAEGAAPKDGESGYSAGSDRTEPKEISPRQPG
jgi:hypothetical protein